MAYGHAERNLAVIRRLEAETERLIRSQEQPLSDEPASPENRDES
jgi:hypothetical protein